jgi:NOL1/NOP2/fmu family ribosome biogenesis protein
MSGNDGQQFDRLPAIDADRERDERPTRSEVLDWWSELFGVPASVFEPYSFWERGKGKIWAFRGDAASPVRVQGLGMCVLRTRQKHWKPTTNAAQRFGDAATRNVVTLSREQAERFLAGEDQAVDWDGDWGYLIAAHDLAGDAEPIGVGLYLHGELRSQVPKGRRREF